MNTREPLYPNQLVPLCLTSVVFLFGTLLLLLLLLLLNFAPFTREHIVIALHPGDVAVGLVIYLKTSIDFALFIGRLMSHYGGWKNRIAIEIGTALGNITGTLLILTVWDAFREIRILMALMILLAALVLLRLAEEGLKNFPLLHRINHFIAPLLNRLIPASTLNLRPDLTWTGLFLLSFTVPFILGSDDFAGYLPLFNIVNVMGFATGVFLGHMLLNIALFLSPRHTIAVVQNRIMAFIGSLAFIGLAVWGIKEAITLLF